MNTHNIILAGIAVACGAMSAHAQTQSADAAYPAGVIADTPAPFAAAPTWEFHTGFDSSRGDYGVLPPTTVSFVPFGIGYHSGRWTFSVDGGWLHVKGPLAYIDISDLADDGLTRNPGAGVTSSNGIADTTLGVKYAALEDFENGLYIDLGARVRAPTASRAKGLGTGHVAGDVAVDVTKILGLWSAFTSLEYGIRDRRDSDRNPWSVTAGAGRSLSERFSVGAFYHWRRSAQRGGSDAHEVFAYAAYSISPRVAVTLYGATGFSRDAVDRELGIRTVLRWP